MAFKFLSWGQKPCSYLSIPSLDGPGVPFALTVCTTWPCSWPLQFEPILDIYEKHLASSEYLAGDKFTMADLSHLPYTALLFPAGEGELITSRPHLAKWWEKISARESWKKVCEMK